MHRHTLLLTIPLSLLFGSCQPSDPADGTPDSPPQDGAGDTGLQAATDTGLQTATDTWSTTVQERIAARARAIVPGDGGFTAGLPDLSLQRAWTPTV